VCARILHTRRDRYSHAGLVALASSAAADDGSSTSRVSYNIFIFYIILYILVLTSWASCPLPPRPPDRSRRTFSLRWRTGRSADIYSAPWWCLGPRIVQDKGWTWKGQSCHLSPSRCIIILWCAFKIIRFTRSSVFTWIIT